MILQKRRRDDFKEGGLQAEMLIMPEDFAAKVNENDGLGYHYVSALNLLRYLKGEDDYYTNDAAQRQYIVKDDVREKTAYGVDINIIAAKEWVQFAIHASNMTIDLSNFQIDVLENLIILLKEMQKYNLNLYVEVGLYTNHNAVEFVSSDDKVHENLNDEKYEKLMNALKDERHYCLTIEDINRRTTGQSKENKGIIRTFFDKFRKILEDQKGDR